MKKDIEKMTNPMTEEELEAVLGGGNGIVNTLTHECPFYSHLFILFH